MSSLKFNYLNYPLSLYYNSLLNVIQSLVFYPPPPSSWKSFLPHQYFGTFPVIYLFFFKSFLEKIIGHLLSSSSTQKRHFERVNIQHTLSTNGWPTVYFVREKNLFWRIIPPLFFDKRFSWLWKTFRRRPYSFWIRIQKVLIFWNHKWQNRKSYS